MKKIIFLSFLFSTLALSYSPELVDPKITIEVDNSTPGYPALTESIYLEFGHYSCRKMYFDFEIKGKYRRFERKLKTTRKVLKLEVIQESRTDCRAAASLIKYKIYIGEKSVGNKLIGFQFLNPVSIGN